MKYQIVKLAGGAAVALGIAAVSGATASASSYCDPGHSYGNQSSYTAQSDRDDSGGRGQSNGGGYQNQSQYASTYASMNGNNMSYGRTQYSSNQMTGRGYRDMDGRWVPYSSSWTDNDWQQYRQQNSSY